MTDNYDRYVTWKRLTHSGARNRDDMTPAEQEEWDAWEFRANQPAQVDAEEARRLYEEATGRSGPTSGAETP